MNSLFLWRRGFRLEYPGGLGAFVARLARWLQGSSRLVVVLAVLPMFLEASLAQGGGGEALSVEPAIVRGLAFLARDAAAWKAEHQCSSCHHGALVAVSMNEAKRRGRDVDEPLLADLTRWLAGAGDGKFNHPRPASAPKALNPKAIYYALGLQSAPSLEDTERGALKRLLATIREDQTEEGSWQSWPDTRPPIFGSSDEAATLLASLALLPAAAGEAGTRAALEKAVQWLERIPSDNDPQSTALRLLLWTGLGRPRAEWLPLVQRVKDGQNRDGGWSQTPGGASDAWATGQALHALGHAGFGQEDQAVKNGQAFLVETQRGDGSWPMASRPAKPGGAGSESLIPITGAGAAWAVMGLAKTAGAPPPPSPQD